VRVTGGFNDFDFGYRLAPGEHLTTPRYYAGFTNGGFGEASRLFRRLQIEEILPDRAARHVRPVLYNSWEATLFAVDEPGQKALAEKVARLGVERFVMDDGWFGARDHDRAGLGDWTVNPKMFPNGLKPLIDNVESLGMDFGLWVEPEMVNPDSDLYRKRPAWALHFPGRPRSEGRNQLILNLARPDVQEYVFGVLDRLLSEHDIRFFKWDMNRHFSEPRWPAVAPEEHKKVWVEYVRSVYALMDRLKAAHPGVEIESCSGGGGRVDLGMLERVEEIWTSDNTEAFDRLRIQEGSSLAYAPKVMMAWVTDVPNMNGRVTPLRYRSLTAMQGSLGIGGNLNHWSDADNKLAAEMVAYYSASRRASRRGACTGCSRPAKTTRRSTSTWRATGGRSSSSPAGIRSTTCTPCRPSGCAASSRKPSTRLPHRAARRPPGRQAADPLRGGPDGARPHAGSSRRLRRDLGVARAYRIAE